MKLEPVTSEDEINVGGKGLGNKKLKNIWPGCTLCLQVHNLDQPLYHRASGELENSSLSFCN